MLSFKIPLFWVPFSNITGNQEAQGAQRFCVIATLGSSICCEFHIKVVFRESLTWDSISYHISNVNNIYFGDFLLLPLSGHAFIIWTLLAITLSLTGHTLFYELRDVWFYLSYLLVDQVLNKTPFWFCTYSWVFVPLRYVESKKDRVTVVFSTVFKDDDDVVIGKVFMQVWSRLLGAKP